MSTRPSHVSENPQENYNRQQQINKLPSEILSQVFILCSQIWTSCSEDGDFPVQERIPAVCRRWRRIALDTLALWTQISITAGTPRPHAPLFLVRSGSTAPLDITLKLVGSPELNAPDRNIYAHQAREATDLIVANGGVFSRWQRLWIRTDTYYAFLPVMDLPQSSSMPTLQYLEIISVEWLVNTGEGHTSPSYGADPQIMPRLSDSPSRLRAVKLGRIPNRYLFGPITCFRPVGLTRLELQFVECYLDLADIHAMLATACSTLITLCLDEDPPTDRPNLGNLSGNFPCMTFPKLRALSLCPNKDLGWSVALLKIFDAPGLNVLRINVPEIDGDYPDCTQVVELLTCYSKDKRQQS